MFMVANPCIIDKRGIGAQPSRKRPSLAETAQRNDHDPLRPQVPEERPRIRDLVPRQRRLRRAGGGGRHCLSDLWFQEGREGADGAAPGQERPHPRQGRGRAEGRARGRARGQDGDARGHGDRRIGRAHGAAADAAPEGRGELRLRRRRVRRGSAQNSLRRKGRAQYLWRDLRRAGQGTARGGRHLQPHSLGPAPGFVQPATQLIPSPRRPCS